MSQNLTQVSLNSWMNFLHFCETTLIAIRYRRVGVLKRQSKELYLRELVKTKEKLNFLNTTVQQPFAVQFVAHSLKTQVHRR